MTKLFKQFTKLFKVTKEETRYYDAKGVCRGL